MIPTCPECNSYQVCYGAEDQMACGSCGWVDPSDAFKVDPLQVAKSCKDCGTVFVDPFHEYCSDCIDNEPPKTANDLQHGGDHYKSNAIQPWDYIIANGMGFLEGSAIKYLSRFREKNGVEDLRKAIHFIEKLIEVEESKK